ncbi:MAG TPA: hypothetical protein VMV10_24130 [Pirellulales bacterium]|nr:hypothetical protein [Pirellulales bacterium]
MKRILLSCLAASLIPAGVVLAEETESESTALSGLKSAFYHAVEKEVRRNREREAGDDEEEESHVVRAMREEEEEDNHKEHGGCHCEKCCQMCEACREHHRRGHEGPHAGLPHPGPGPYAGRPPHAPAPFDHQFLPLPGHAIAHPGAVQMMPPAGHGAPQIVYVIVGGHEFVGGPWSHLHHGHPGRRPGAEFERRRPKHEEEEHEEEEHEYRRPDRNAAELHEQMELLHRQMRENEARAREVHELREQLERLHGEVRELAEILRDMRRER